MGLLSLKISVVFLLLIAGTAMPLALGILALARGGRFASNRYLGTFLLLFSVHFAVFGFSAREVLLRVPFLLVLLDGLPFFYGPLFLFYLRAFVRQANPRPRATWLHLAPGAADMGLYLALFLLRGREYFLTGIQRAFAGRPYWFVPVLDGLKVVSGLSYAVAILLLLRSQRQRLRKWAQYRTHRAWVRTVFTSFVVVWTVVLGTQLYGFWVGFGTASSELRTAISAAAFVLFSAVLAFFSLRHPVVLEPKEARLEIRRNLNLSADQVADVTRRLERLVAEGFYTDSDASLASTARAIGVHPNVLSFVINDGFDMGFREFVNGLRLKSFLDHATEGALAASTILGLAIDAGFPAKSTFNRVFKNRYGLSPQEYLKKRSHSS
jgi:AraC-like DNA-binding protein